MGLIFCLQPLGCKVMTFTRTVVSILAAATVAAGLLAATSAWAHHGDGDGTSGNGREAPGAKFAAPLRDAPATGADRSR